MIRSLRLLPPIAAALLVSACASDQPGFLPTASVAPPAEDAAPKREARVDPACVALANQIQSLRGEGTIDRLEKVAAGKGDNVQVKRTAIAKQAELNRANAEFQAKCGPRIPTTTTAAVATPAAAAAAKAAPAAKAAAVKAAPQPTAPSGVTSVAPPAKAQ